MRRWNGWGDDTVQYPVTARAASYLTAMLGPGEPPQDIELSQLLAAMPQSRLTESMLFTSDDETRLRHARGQSLPDWIALRSGSVGVYPDGVAFPSSEEDIADLIRFATQRGTHLIPYGGGTSVAGHINPIKDDAPSLTVSLRHMNRLKDLDKTSHLATFGAGASGPEIEATLRAQGFTLGHYPQSFEYSTLGGWIATRSKGQQALHYGRIEDLFAGGSLLAPSGRMTMPPHPASAAGPDLRQLVLGSEGRMGIISEATVRVSPVPEAEQFHGLFFPDFSAGQTAVRDIVQARLPLSMLRLSTAAETETTLLMAGHERLLGMVQRYLGLRGVTEDKVMLLAGFTGSERVVDAARKEALAIAARCGGVHLGRQFGKQWLRSRFYTPYLRNSLWELGYAVDTLETAVPWRSVDKTLCQVEAALRDTLEGEDQPIHIFSHLSHLYNSGASIYVTYIYRLSLDWETNLERWQSMKQAASKAIVQNNGTISHQHGVGIDHRDFLAPEKDELGMLLIGDAIQRMDPVGIMNPGKMIAQ